MTLDRRKKLSLWTRALPVFMLWTAARAAYFVYLGSADPGYRIAAESGFGAAVWAAQILYAFLATGAAVAMWSRWQHVAPVTLAALGVYSSLTVFQLLQMERNPIRARRAYAASRTARGLPVSDERLDVMFSPAGRSATWAIGVVFCLAPLAIFLWRRRDFEPVNEKEAVVLGIESENARIAEARRLEAGGYGPSPIPSDAYDRLRGEHRLVDPRRVPLDDTLAALCCRLVADPAADLAAVRHAIDMEQFYTLIAFGRRAAVFAMRERRVERLREALCALALIERERVDYRDIVWALAIVRHAAIRIDANVIALFFAAASKAEQGTAELMKASAAESATATSIRDEWGYVEVQTVHGVGLIQWGSCPYDPTVDVPALAIELALLLDNDRYTAADPTIATFLPGIWLGESDSPGDVKTALLHVRAVASVSADARSEAPWHDRQRLLLFAAELPSVADVRRLVERSRAIRRANDVIVPVSRDRLFCLLIAQSPQAHMRPDETPETLQRFVPGIEAALNRFVR